MDFKKYMPILNVFLFILLFAVSVKFLSLLVSQHTALIHHPYQIEFREGASLNITQGLDKGINPYLVENQPWYADNFGIVYPLLALPVTHIWGMNLLSMRIVSAFAILVCIMLFFIALRKEKVNLWYTIAACVILYGCCLYYVTPICRADSTAMMFFLLSWFIPVFFKYSSRSLLIGMVFSVLSFYTKQYGILCFGVLLAYVFFFVSMRRALLMGTLFGLLLAGSMLLMSHFFECYFFNTTLSMVFSASNDYGYSFHQMSLLFFQYMLGITLLLVSCAVAYAIYRYKHIKQDASAKHLLASRKLFNTSHFTEGFLTMKADPYVFYAIFFFLFLLIRLGGNQGTFMTYHFQLLSFALIIIGMKYASIYLTNLQFLVVPLVLYAMYTSTTAITSMGFFKPEYAADWEKVKGILAQPVEVLNDDVIAAEMIYSGRRPYLSGLTAYFFYSTLNENVNKRFPLSQRLMRQDAFRELIQKDIRVKKFDYIIFTKNHWVARDNVIEPYYTRADSVNLNMYYTGQDWRVYIWKPKPNDQLGSGSSLVNE